MPINNHHSSILTEQELQLLASQSSKLQSFNFTVYSYHLPLQLNNCYFYLADTVEQLILMLTASSTGSALVLPDSIESHPQLNELLKFLKIRADIQIFWVGQMPSMQLDIPDFEYCFYLAHLLHNLDDWQQRAEYIFQQWLEQFPVTFITDKLSADKMQQPELKSIGLKNIEFFDSTFTAAEIKNKQLLIIDLTVNELSYIELLDDLASHSISPILILFGDLPENLCQSAYNLAQNKGFSILAYLPSTPDTNKWQRLLHSLYAKVYLKHWINTPAVKKKIYAIYNIENQAIDSYLCLYGITKKRIAQLNKHGNVQKIISLQSLQEWFPDKMHSKIHHALADELHCSFKQLAVYIEKPEQIQTTSELYAVLLMIGLARLRIYWLVDDETQLSADILKNFPISDVIFSETISHHLLGEPSKELLSFIKQAKAQKIHLGATLQQNQEANDAMSLYGIEFILN